VEVAVCSWLVNEVGCDYETLVKARLGDRLDWFMFKGVPPIFLSFI